MTYQPSELVRNRIINRTAPFSNDFFDSFADVLYMGLKICLELPAEKVYELFFWDWDANPGQVTLYDPVTAEMLDADVSTCNVWNEYENRFVCGLQTAIDVIETLMPKGE